MKKRRTIIKCFLKCDKKLANLPEISLTHLYETSLFAVNQPLSINKGLKAIQIVKDPVGLDTSELLKYLLKIQNLSKYLVFRKNLIWGILN